MPMVGRQDDETARLRYRGNGNIGEARMMTSNDRCVMKHSSDTGRREIK